MATKSTTTNKPVKVFRAQGVSASIFRNVSEDSGAAFYKVSVQRTYKQDGEFRSTNSFGRDELPTAMLLMQKAWSYIIDSDEPAASDGSDE